MRWVFLPSDGQKEEVYNFKAEYKKDEREIQLRGVIFYGSSKG